MEEDYIHTGFTICDIDEDNKNEIITTWIETTSTNPYDCTSKLLVIETDENKNMTIESVCYDGVSPENVYAFVRAHMGDESDPNIYPHLQICYRNSYTPTLYTWNGSQLIKRFSCGVTNVGHGGNPYDIDGDGYDEFVSNGIVDYADVVGGNVVYHEFPWKLQIMDDPEGGGRYGIHYDHAVMYDFDPTREGAEIIIASDDYSSKNNYYLPGVGMNVTCSCIEAKYPNPQRLCYEEYFQHGQRICPGNFINDDEYPGFEALFLPKNDYWKGTVSQNKVTAGILVGFTGCTGPNWDMLAWGGIDWFTIPNGHVMYPRCSGPGLAWEYQINWDSDPFEDELFHEARYALQVEPLYIWDIKKFPVGYSFTGDNPFLDPYLGGLWDWIWQRNIPCNVNGNPKTLEYNPGGGEECCPKYYFNKILEMPYYGIMRSVKPIDVMGDWREELCCITARDYKVPMPPEEPYWDCAKFVIFYNDKPNNNPACSIRPRKSQAYKDWNWASVKYHTDPFDYRDLLIERIEIEPGNYGMEDGAGPVQLKAYGIARNGEKDDISEYVTWRTDNTGIVTINANGELYSVEGKEGTAWIWADYEDEHVSLRSNVAYIYVVKDPVWNQPSPPDIADFRPCILTAGFKDTYLEMGQSSDLKIEARVTDLTNLPELTGQDYYVALFDDQGDLWTPPGYGSGIFLFDDGLASHGDEKEGDGIYSRIIPNGQSLLYDGQNKEYLLQIKAQHPVLDLYGPDYISEPWPFMIVGEYPTNNPQISGEYDNDDQGESMTPMIRSGGIQYVGSPQPDVFRYRLEVEVDPPPVGQSYQAINFFPPVGFVYILRNLDKTQKYFTYANVSYGDGRFLYQALYKCKDASNNRYFSDMWPRIRIHDPE